MSFQSGQVQLNAATPTVLVPAVNASWPKNAEPGRGPGRYVRLANESGVLVYVGGSDVSSATGYNLGSGAADVDLWLYPDEVIYAIAASATPTISYMQSGA